MQTNSDLAATVRGYFETIAPRYDCVNSLLSCGLHHLWRRRAIRTAQLRRGERVLDACGGTGDLGLSAAARTGGAGLVCVYDFSPAMLARALVKQSGRRRVQVVCGDAQMLALRDCSFDVVLIGFGLRNLQNMRQGLRELHRVLKRGGRLVCLEFSRPRSVWLRVLYDIYSFYVIPWVGGRLGRCREAYRYLPDSIRRFPLPDRLAELLRDAGFTEVACDLLAGGIAAVHTAVKHDGA